MTWLLRILTHLPTWLQRALAIGVTIGLAIAIPLGTLLYWQSGHLQRMLGLPQPVTTHDVEQVTSGVQLITEDRVSTAADFAARHALRAYDDSLRHVARILTDSVATPMLQQQADLVRRMRAIERELGVTNQRLTTLPAPDNDGIRQLIDQARQPRAASRDEEILHEMRLLNERIRSVEDHVRRTSKARL